MILPPGVCEEAAKILHEFWEGYSAAADKRMTVPWSQLEPKYQMMWINVTRLVLEMYSSVLLTDIHKFLNQSNGDLGAAFARALRRYAKEQMNTTIKP